MEAGLNLFSIRDLIKTEEELTKTLIQLKSLGYSYVQYSGAEFNADRIYKASKASDMPIYLTHVPMDRIIGDTDSLMEEHDKIGCKNIGLGMMPIEIIVDEKACKEKIAQLEMAAEKMKKNGFQFFYHHHHFEFYKFSDGTTVFEYMLKNTKNIHFTADTYWLQYGGINIIEYFKKLKGRVECVHLKDYRITYDENNSQKLSPHFAPVGDGNLNFKEIVKAAKESDAKYYFVEQDDAVSYANPIEQVARSIRYIRQNL